MVSLLETCKGCEGTGFADDHNIASCFDCNGEGVVFIGFGDDRPTLVARQMLDYLITDYTLGATIDRMSKQLIQELIDHELDEAAAQAERMAEDGLG